MKIAMLSMGLLMAGAARADEQKVEVKDLPRPVLAAVKAKFPEAKVTGAAKEEEDGKTVYEVAIEDDERTIELALTPKGKVLEVEKTIAPKKLPTAVRAAIEAKYPKAKIKKAEKVVKYDEDEDDDGKGKKTFEVVLADEGEDDVEVKLTPKGKILADAGDEDDEKGEAGKKAEKKPGKDDEGGKKAKKSKKDGD